MNKLISNNLLTKNDVTFLKGFGIFLVLIHHIFWRHPEFSINFFGVNVLHEISLKAKVGVSFFVFLSGFGLTQSVKEKKFSFKQFYVKRFLKVFPTYWFVFLLFLIVNVLLLDKNLKLIYEGDHFVIKMLINILGIQEFFNFRGMNATWWYISLIIGLYILFPTIHLLIKKAGFVGLIPVFLVMFVENVPFISIEFLTMLVLTFSVGVYLAESEWMQSILYNFCNSKLAFISLMSLTALCVFLRPAGNTRAGVMFDTIFSCVLMLLLLVLSKNTHIIKGFFSLFGKVSYEIFLSHGLIYYYVFDHLIQYLSNPLFVTGMIFAALALGLVINYICTFIVSLRTPFGKITRPM